MLSAEILLPLESIQIFFFSTEIKSTLRPALLHKSTGTTTSISSEPLATSTAILNILSPLL
jgi:hypothetical protein